MSRNSTSRRNQTGTKPNRPSWVPIAIIFAAVLLIGAIVAKILIPAPTKVNVGPSICNTSRPVAPKLPSSACIILDNSDSMRGYAQSISFANILSDIKGIYTNTSLRLTDGSTVEGDWIAKLRTGKVNFVSHSQIDADIKMAVQFAVKEKENPLAILVTDGIMSGSNDQIRADADYNLTHASELRNKVTAALSSVGKKEVGVAVYEYMVSFTGTYYCFNNAHGTIASQLRRFYAVAIGAPDAIAQFNGRIHALKGDSRPRNAWLAIDRLPLGGGVTLANDAVDFEPVSKDTPVFFVDRDKWATCHNPLIVKLDVERLLSNQIVRPEGLLKAVAINCSVDDTKVGVSPELKGTQLVIEVPDELIPRNKDNDVVIRLTMDFKDDKLPEWVMLATTTNDSSMLKSPNSQTFLFNQLMEGISAGMTERTGIHLYSENILICDKSKKTQTN